MRVCTDTYISGAVRSNPNASFSHQYDLELRMALGAVQ